MIEKVIILLAAIAIVVSSIYDNRKIYKESNRKDFKNISNRNILRVILLAIAAVCSILL
ncbi:hypothetical protein SAMN04488096_103237 [Mesonia phycicola]|uniref:Uncharacterized protein n=1 Tax=Mesonia phycicola TaxID=579105 RepID=A0A1M6D062_9FLAO|nr:hypothetical protein [Mesonia phycicola]SHI66589.1 hypothetical protein SAMN04488096_103237 [Mesonia phycicola]